MNLLRHDASVVYRFSHDSPEEQPPPVGYELLLLDGDAISHFFGRPDTDPWRARTYPRLFDEGCVGFLLHKNDEWAAVQWMATPVSTRPPQLPRHVTRNRYWCFNEHTHAEHRHRGLWNYLKGVGIRTARNSANNENQVIYSDTGLENLASRRAHQSFGFSANGVVRTTTFRLPRIASLTIGSWSESAIHPEIHER